MDAAVCSPVRSCYSSCLCDRIDPPDFLRLLPDHCGTIAVADYYARVSHSTGTRSSCLPVLGMLLLLLIINDAVLWHVVPLIVIAVLAEAVRGMTNYSRSGDVVAGVLMSFSSFGYYGQIWFNRAYTYECAVEEMPAGYGDTLMAVSPVWAFPVVVIVGIIVSVVIANVSMKKNGTKKKHRTNGE